MYQILVPPMCFFYLSKGPKSPKNKAVLCADLQLPSRKKKGTSSDASVVLQ